MNRKKYCAGDCDFRKYYVAQAGGALSDISVFRGVPYQRGFGIGALIGRFGIPVLKFLGKHLLKAGLAVGADVLSSKPVKSSLKERAKEGVNTAAKEVLEKLSNSMNQSGQGLYKAKKKKKRTRKDIFS